jgi:hypothetical protein
MHVGCTSMSCESWILPAKMEQNCEMTLWWIKSWLCTHQPESGLAKGAHQKTGSNYGALNYAEYSQRMASLLNCDKGLALGQRICSSTNGQQRYGWEHQATRKCTRGELMEGTMCLSKWKQIVGTTLWLQFHPKWLTLFRWVQCQ